VPVVLQECIPAAAAIKGSFKFRWITYPLPAGFPSPASDYEEDSLNLSEYLGFGKPSVFLFTVAGDSMTGAGIEDGDKVIVDRALTPKHRDIVVAIVDGEYTLKRLHMSYGRIALHPENASYKPLVMTEGQQLEIWGVVVGVIRRYT
jgi:DNA polymerase V